MGVSSSPRLVANPRRIPPCRRGRHRAGAPAGQHGLPPDRHPPPRAPQARPGLDRNRQPKGREGVSQIPNPQLTLAPGPAPKTLLLNFDPRFEPQNFIPSIPFITCMVYEGLAQRRIVCAAINSPPPNKYQAPGFVFRSEKKDPRGAGTLYLGRGSFILVGGFVSCGGKKSCAFFPFLWQV